MSFSAAATTHAMIQSNNSAVAGAAGFRLTGGGDLAPRGLAMAQRLLSCVLLAFGALVLVKAVLLGVIGGAGYAAALNALSQGSVLDHGAAWIMQADAASMALADVFGLLFP